MMDMTDMRFVRGVCIGLIAGAAVGATLMPRRKNNKNVASKALRTAGEVLEQITDAIGL